MYFITTIITNPDLPEGDQVVTTKTWGYYKDFPLSQVMEDNYNILSGYNYLVISEIPEGLLELPQCQYWFKINKSSISGNITIEEMPEESIPENSVVF